MPLSFLPPVLAGLLSLALSIWLLVANSTAYGLQGELQKKQTVLQEAQLRVQTQQQAAQTQQEQIQSGSTLAQKVGPQVLQDLAGRAVKNKNVRIRELLKKHDLSIQDESPDPSAGKPAAATPAPRAGTRLPVPAHP